MAEYVDDQIAWPHLTGLRDAVQPELDLRGLPGICDGFVGAGSELAFDQCSADCDGMLWTRLVSAYPSTNFPAPVDSPVRGPLVMAEVFEVGLVRGLEVPSDPREGMDTAVLADAAEVQLADMSALLSVICAYFSSRLIPYVIGTYTPYGPAGTCVGGSWTVTAQSGIAPRPS